MAGYIGSKAVVVSSGAERKKVFAITTSTTSLTGLVYTPGQVHVFHNGIRLVDGTDYTATDGTTITLTNAAANGDEVVVVSYASFQTSDTVSASAGGTFAAPVTIDGNSATVLTVDRTTSDGTVIDVQKNGSTVGSLSVSDSDRLNVNSGVMGFKLYDDGQAILPTNGSGTNADAQVSLGGSTVRFRDLYLSGSLYPSNGVYLGGTGAANKLDDYEEGTWTPTSPDGTMQATNGGGNRYTKIGNVVYCEMDTRFFTSTSGSSTRIRGLPFTPLIYGTGNVGWSEFGVPTDIHIGSSDIYIMDNDASRHLTYAQASGKRLIASFMFTTNS